MRFIRWPRDWPALGNEGLPTTLGVDTFEHGLDQRLKVEDAPVRTGLQGGTTW